MVVTRLSLLGLAVSFSATTFANVWKAHMNLLGRMREEAPEKYHRVMSDILTAIWYVVFLASF